MEALENITITKEEAKYIKEKIVNVYYAIENEDNEELAQAPTYKEARTLKKEIKQIDREEHIEEKLIIVKHIETETKAYSIY